LSLVVLRPWAACSTRSECQSSHIGLLETVYIRIRFAKVCADLPKKLGIFTWLSATLLTHLVQVSHGHAVQVQALVRLSIVGVVVLHIPAARQQQGQH